MEIELRLSTAEDAHVIKNLWPLYQHEVSEFDSSKPNPHGLFGADDKVSSLAEHIEGQEPWWREPEVLFPYLIFVDGRPAGFNLVAVGARLPEGMGADFVVHEFFVLHAYRGSGVAEQAAHAGFERHKGKWEIVTYPSHARAIAFWRRVVLAQSPSALIEAALNPWRRPKIPGGGPKPWRRLDIFRNGWQS